MKRLGLALVCSLFIVHCSLLIVEADQLLVGAAKLDLSPPVKTPLAGYSRRKGKLANGIHDPPFVRAVVIQDGKAAVAMASCDLLIIDELLFDAVRKRINTTHPHTPIGLLVAATHTHSGPGAYGQKFLEKLSMGHFDSRVFEFLATRIAQAIETAAAHTRPATIAYATASTTGLVINRMEPGGIVDPELAVLGFYDQEKALIAAVVSFGAHATTLGSWNMQLSADYPGILAEVVERSYPALTSLFVAGAVGDQAPVKRGGGFDQASLLGTELARHVVALLEQPALEVSPKLIIEQHTLSLPPARLRLGKLFLPRWISRSFVDDDATLTVAALGRTLLIGIPCDLSAGLGLELKAHARALGYQPLLVGFANDYIGYCLPERLYRTDTYEASMAFNGPTAGPMLVGELKRMIDQLPVIRDP